MVAAKLSPKLVQLLKFTFIFTQYENDITLYSLKLARKHPTTVADFPSKLYRQFDDLYVMIFALVIPKGTLY